MLKRLFASKFLVLSLMLEWIFPSFSLSWVYDLIFLAYVCTIFSIIIIVVSENRNPVRTLAWITVLLMLPAFGIVLYVFFGRNIRNQHKLSRRNRRKLRKREPDPHADYKSLGLSQEAIQEIRLGNGLAGAHFYPGNKVEVFTAGYDKFEKLKSDLRKAKSYINIEYYIFNNDKIGCEISDILIERALAGVVVRVIYDHVGSLFTPNKFFKRMKDAGIEVFPFMRVAFPVFGSRVNWRNHRKLCVIDGKIGYLGGMNIADRYIDGGKEFKCWRDTHVRVKGPIVAALQHSFAVDWHFMGKPLNLEKIDTSTVKGTVGAQLVTSGPTSQWPNIAFMFHKAISNANRRVYIQTPYFLPTDELLKDLIAASLSHVDVRIMIPRKCDSRLLNFASASYITQCLQAGIKMYFYEPGMLHAKMIVVDDNIASIGSTNFDFRSFEHNFEGNLFFYSPDFVNRILDIFRADMENCTRIYTEKWKHRPLWRRSLESVIRLLSPIL